MVRTAGETANEGAQSAAPRKRPIEDTSPLPIRRAIARACILIIALIAVGEALMLALD